jgi:phosphatidylethanolamine-binding protein (PEBP) family uncharacterized protein
MFALICRRSASRLTSCSGFTLTSLRAVQTSAKEKKSSSPAPSTPANNKNKTTTARIIPGFEPKPVIRPDERKLTNEEWRACSFNKKAELMANYHEVFPDVVPAFKPRINLIVELSEGTLLSRGNTFNPAQASTKPSVQYHVRGNRWYSLIMLDPDFPSRTQPLARSWVHWFVANIPGNAVHNGETLIDYVPPLPPKKSGAHRYVTVLFEQLGQQTDFSALPRLSSTELEGRAGVNCHDLMLQFNLAPKGLAFGHAEWQPDVTKHFATLGLEELEMKRITSRKPKQSQRKFAEIVDE